MAEKILNKINNKNLDFVIFYSDWCQFSINALNLMKRNKKSFKAYKIDKIKMDNLLKYLKTTKNKTNFDENHKTRPIIFKKGIFLGGYTDLLNKL
jgi:glutaredoxin